MSKVLASVDQRTQLAGHNRLEILTFRLHGKQRYGLNVFKIQEVLQCPHLTAVPQSHKVVRGIANMRGKTVPVLDLGMAIGKKEVADPGESFVVVTEFNRSIQGFLVHQVDRIVNMNWEQILPPPSGSGSESYLTAVTNIDGELVEIIDVEKVLSEVIGFDGHVSQEVLAGIDAKPEEEIPPHILVADDSMVARNQIKRTMDQIGVECTLANDGRMALDILEKWAQDTPEKIAAMPMIISDVEMPEMDGYTLTTKIRADHRLDGIYVLLHTSLSGVFNHAMVEKVGANEFIAKFKPDLLADAVLKRIKSHAEE